ncbi:MAG: succinate dehydrogenase cytochrome b subunit [Fibrobacter sp.]|nr:succinate dehydrogenase cytochrome b subunit [Fibrobacter sp.]MDY6389250.1 succinate dehydrogenase cytochrome b subunit [Fibrobacter sp.]
MQWIIKYLTSSIGKKQIMGVSGACLALFILGHMVGNLQLINMDQAAAQAHFNAYSQLLTGMKPLIYFVELGLVALFIIHVGLAIRLKIENRKARGPEAYEVNARKGHKTFASFTMIWSGIFILGFVIQHLMVLKFGDYYMYENEKGEIIRDMWLTTIDMFASPFWTAFYLISMFVIGMHLFHAISSAFQTMGIAHQKWTPIIDKLGIAYSLIVALGFAFEAAFSCYIANTDEVKALRDTARSEAYQQKLEVQKQKQLQEKESKKTSAVKLDEGFQYSYVMNKEGAC